MRKVTSILFYSFLLFFSCSFEYPAFFQKPIELKGIEFDKSLFSFSSRTINGFEYKFHQKKSTDCLRLKPAKDDFLSKNYDSFSYIDFFQVNSECYFLVRIYPKKAENFTAIISDNLFYQIEILRNEQYEMIAVKKEIIYVFGSWADSRSSNGVLLLRLKFNNEKPIIKKKFKFTNDSNWKNMITVQEIKEPWFKFLGIIEGKKESKFQLIEQNIKLLFY